jgi:hypothetical protein
VKFKHFDHTSAFCIKEQKNCSLYTGIVLFVLSITNITTTLSNPTRIIRMKCLIGFECHSETVVQRMDIEETPWLWRKIILARTQVHVSFEVFTEVTMKNCVFWYVTPCGSYKNRRFEGN